MILKRTVLSVPDIGPLRTGVPVSNGSRLNSTAIPSFTYCCGALSDLLLVLASLVGAWASTNGPLRQRPISTIAPTTTDEHNESLIWLVFLHPFRTRISPKDSAAIQITEI